MSEEHITLNKIRGVLDLRVKTQDLGHSPSSGPSPQN